MTRFRGVSDENWLVSGEQAFLAGPGFGTDWFDHAAEDRWTVR